MRHPPTIALVALWPKQWSICRDLSYKICGVVPIGRRSRTRAKTSLFFHLSAFFHFTRWETFFASQAISMNVIAGIWTLPIGVATYTMAGGIKATILTDYAHNIIVYVLILTCMFVAYATSSLLSSPGAVFDALQESYTKCTSCRKFWRRGPDHVKPDWYPAWRCRLTSAFGSTVDAQLFQKAIAASPKATLPGYFVGSLAWLAIPFGLATIIGLACRAIENNPSFPTYPRPMSELEYC
jgi:Na+/proline symporter